MAYSLNVFGSMSFYIITCVKFSEDVRFIIVFKSGAICIVKNFIQMKILYHIKTCKSSK